MLRKIRFGRTFGVSTLNRWCHTNKDSASINKVEAATVSNESESTKDTGTEVPEVDTDKLQLQDPSTENEERILKLLDSAATYSDANNKEWATLPYPADVSLPHNAKEKQDPRDTSLIIFPGQGIIYVGLIRKYLCFPKVKELFDCASEILNYNLMDLCLKGPQEKLYRTDFNQVATVVSSLAALEKLTEERPTAFENCWGALGYSVGELTSLIFSEAISFEDGIRLVAARGAAMLYASQLEPQGMLSVTTNHASTLHAALQHAKEWAKNDGVPTPICQIAIYPYTNTKILGGHDVALKFIEANAKQFNLSSVKRLPVTGAFHTPLMVPALKRYTNALEQINIRRPKITVYSNHTGSAHGNPDSIKRNLIKQVVKAVKWEQCMHTVFSRPPSTGFPNIFDVGSAGKMKVILRQTNVQAAKSCFVY